MYLQIAQKIGIPLLLLIGAGIYYLDVGKGNPQDLMLIKPVCILMALLFFINAATDLWTIRKASEKSTVTETTAALKKILLFSLLTVALVALMPFLGFVLAAAVFLYLVFRLFAVDTAMLLYLLPPGVSIALYMMFEILFDIPLPQGFLGF